MHRRNDRAEPLRRRRPFLLVLAFFVRSFTSYGHAAADAQEYIPTDAREAARSYHFYGV